jgi:hypothetical protein
MPLHQPDAADRRTEPSGGHRALIRRADYTDTRRYVVLPRGRRIVVRTGRYVALVGGGAAMGLTTAFGRMVAGEIDEGRHRASIERAGDRDARAGGRGDVEPAARADRSGKNVPVRAREGQRSLRSVRAVGRDRAGHVLDRVKRPRTTAPSPCAVNRPPRCTRTMSVLPQPTGDGPPCR